MDNYDDESFSSTSDDDVEIIGMRYGYEDDEADIIKQGDMIILDRKRIFLDNEIEMDPKGRDILFEENDDGIQDVVLVNRLKPLPCLYDHLII